MGAPGSRYYLVNDRPVAIVPTRNGGTDCVVFDLPGRGVNFTLAELVAVTATGSGAPAKTGCHPRRASARTKCYRGSGCSGDCRGCRARERLVTSIAMTAPMTPNWMNRSATSSEPPPPAAK
jgi:hypothetical protein